MWLALLEILVGHYFIPFDDLNVEKESEPVDSS